MLQEQGHAMSLYDIYYHPDTKVLDNTYDFMTATEVIEHLYQPNQVWQQWLNLVKPGGWIGLMTKMVIDVEAFATWHYKNDPTHVVFFSRNTFRYLAERDQLELEFIGNDVILLRKAQ
jgi:2-polyprenyl-3-methyl-5-hydroxy-6-metoxy-1,4-benzoquinol methylase